MVYCLPPPPLNVFLVENPLSLPKPACFFVFEDNSDYSDEDIIEADENDEKEEEKEQNKSRVS